MNGPSTTRYLSSLHTPAMGQTAVDFHLLTLNEDLLLYESYILWSAPCKNSPSQIRLSGPSAQRDNLVYWQGEESACWAVKREVEHYALPLLWLTDLIAKSPFRNHSSTRTVKLWVYYCVIDRPGVKGFFFPPQKGLFCMFQHFFKQKGEKQE